MSTIWFFLYEGQEEEEGEREEEEEERQTEGEEKRKERTQLKLAKIGIAICFLEHTCLISVPMMRGVSSTKVICKGRQQKQRLKISPSERLSKGLVIPS